MLYLARSGSDTRTKKKRVRFNLKMREKYLQFQLWCASVITRGIKMRVQQSIWFVGVWIWNRENGSFENQKRVIIRWSKCGWWWPQTPQIGANLTHFQIKLYGFYYLKIDRKASEPKWTDFDLNWDFFGKKHFEMGFCGGWCCRWKTWND